MMTVDELRAQRDHLVTQIHEHQDALARARGAIDLIDFWLAKMGPQAAPVVSGAEAAPAGAAAADGE